jgi:hypothetical protein
MTFSSSDKWPYNELTIALQDKADGEESRIYLVKYIYYSWACSNNPASVNRTEHIIELQCNRCVHYNHKWVEFATKMRSLRPPLIP